MNQRRYKRFRNYWRKTLPIIRGHRLSPDEKQEIDFWAREYALNVKKKLKDYFQGEYDIYNMLNFS